MDKGDVIMFLAIAFIVEGVMFSVAFVEENTLAFVIAGISMLFTLVAGQLVDAIEEEEEEFSVVVDDE